MTSTDYEHECMRAELLGLEKPDKSLFTKNEIDAASFETLAVEGEQLGRVSGGLDELNSVIVSTKKKLSRYQSITGRIGSLIRKSSDSKSSPERKAENNAITTSSGTQGMSAHSLSPSSNAHSEEVEKQVDKLDQLLRKAEYAEMSLGHNNKLIKKIIRK